MKIRNRNDFAVGTGLAAIAVLVLVVSRDYPMGTAANMDTGYIPRALAVMLLLLSLLMTGRSLAVVGEGIQSWSLRPVIAVIGGVFLFAAMLDVAGIVVSTFALVWLGRLAAPERPKPIETSMLGVALGLASAAIFVGGLGLPLPVWPNFHG
ncbi:tripartite tricarboxylate transporter TctB family protein [Chelativorans sp. AA-79]|uniref:tripartite tricarboxylate transporter TctB family protein n=1 Tax=Chelativorans sp. AA-79 TaxID=3028735 RepID=UPI0023FA03A9|nr:tripartite tricarboxylate transporter TctB family protein [Chelativorans sp. AA-79]WEX12274.1 tripartite tricarboxylate transporter TctB family protein [Chelativorans sp. AA-79]